MIYIIVSWMYITLVSFLTGTLLTTMIRRMFNIQQRTQLHFSLVCINGLLLTSFIVSVWTLFYKVDLAANLFILALAIFSIFFNKKHLSEQFRGCLEGLKNSSRITWLFFFLFVLVMACISFIPSSHADDAGCFSPAIKWAQEFRAMPGIANLDARLGYNSTWFGLQALYGFAFLHAGLFNDLNGLLFLYMLIYSLNGVDRLLEGESSWLAYLRALFFLPVLFIYFGFSHDLMLYNIQFFTSPTYDIPVTFIMWLLFLMFLELRDRREPPGSSVLFYLVMLYAVALVTIKLNAVPLLIINLFLLVLLLRKKMIGRFLLLSGLHVLIILPWMIKTVINSGYLLFPFAELDLLQVDWKLTPRAVLYIENSVISWAIDPELYGSTQFSNDLSRFSVPVKEWFPVWFPRQNYINTVIFFLLIIILAGYFIKAFMLLIRQRLSFFQKHIFDIVLMATIIAGLLLWFTRGPMFRYGYGYILFLLMMGITWFIYYFVKEFHAAYTGVFLLAWVFYALIYYSIKLNGPFQKTLFQKPPATASLPYTRVDMGDGKYIHVVDGPACGNTPLPSAAGYVFRFLQPAYRGDHIRDGFVNSRPREEYSLEKE